MWYSFFLSSLIFTASITALLLRIRNALEEVYVIVVTPVHSAGQKAKEPSSRRYQPSAVSQNKKLRAES
jgi:hypothetical protein